MEGDTMSDLEFEYRQYLRKQERKQNRGKRGRDSERMKTYRAEWAFLSQVDNKEFKDIKEAQKVAKRIYKTKTWQKLWKEGIDKDVTRLFFSEIPVEMKQRNTGRGTAGFTNGNKVVLDTKVGLNMYTLLHELSHCLGHMHHGRSFRRTVVALVGTFMGAKAKKILKAEFKKAKLSYGKPRKPLDFEAWKASRERMLKIQKG